MYRMNKECWGWGCTCLLHVISHPFRAVQTRHIPDTPLQ